MLQMLPPLMRLDLPHMGWMDVIALCDRFVGVSAGEDVSHIIGIEPSSAVALSAAIGVQAASVSSSLPMPTETWPRTLNVV